MNELEVKRVPFMGTDLMAAKDESGTINAVQLPERLHQEPRGQEPAGH